MTDRARTVVRVASWSIAVLLSYIVLPVGIGIVTTHASHAGIKVFESVGAQLLCLCVAVLPSVALPWFVRIHWAFKLTASITSLAWSGYWSFLAAVATACGSFGACL